MGDGEAGSENGVALDAYSQALPGMPERVVNAVTGIPANAYKRVAGS